MAKSNPTPDAPEPDVPAEAEAAAEESGYTDSGDVNANITWFPGLPAYTSTPDAEHEWQLEHNPSYQGQLAPKKDTKGSGKK